MTILTIPPFDSLRFYKESIDSTIRRKQEPGVFRHNHDMLKNLYFFCSNISIAYVSLFFQYDWCFIALVQVWSYLVLIKLKDSLPPTL